jgi:branched-chain amino acid transport system ATP-binding protein
MRMEPRMAERLLEVNDLRCGYGEAVVLSGVSFALDAGQSLALLGRNGTGKTTLIDTLVGVTRRHAGRIVLGGREIQTLPSHERVGAANWQGLGWVPQERNIFKSLTVEENLSAVARPGPWSAQRVFELFPRLAERKRNLGTQLSGGEQQMLAFGRALVLNPKLLLLDEPLEGLAPLIVAELLAAIARVAREEGLSSIVVEQHPHMVLKVTDQAIVLDRGGIAYRAGSAALLDDPTPLDAWLGVAAH